MNRRLRLLRGGGASRPVRSQAEPGTEYKNVCREFVAGPRRAELGAPEVLRLQLRKKARGSYERRAFRRTRPASTPLSTSDNVPGSGTAATANPAEGGPP